MKEVALIITDDYRGRSISSWLYSVSRKVGPLLPSIDVIWEWSRLCHFLIQMVTFMSFHHSIITVLMCTFKVQMT